jgi:pyruvate/2-oxoacid:ferredoxin oxidoreductase alpha subunit
MMEGDAPQSYETLETDEPPWTLHKELTSNYVQMFEDIDSDNLGFISAEDARKVFISTGISRETLSQIWSFSIWKINY